MEPALETAKGRCKLSSYQRRIQPSCRKHVFRIAISACRVKDVTASRRVQLTTARGRLVLSPEWLCPGYLQPHAFFEGTIGPAQK
jgi:hypothetical protein